VLPLALAGCGPAPPPDGAEAALEPPPGREGSEAGPVTGAESALGVPERPEGPGAQGERIEAPLVLFVGTSLTEGLGLADPDAEAWPARVEARAREEGWSLRVRNAGLSGETSAGALRRIDWVLDEPPAVVVLETGANDGLRGLPVAELEANLEAILGRIRERAPGARVVLTGMEAPPNMGAAYASAFRDVFPRVARRWGAELVPFLLDGVAGEPDLNQADRIHPTAEGHDRMADTAWEILEEVLRSAMGTVPSGG
jgi:acyl-CoA thioesterase I